MTAGQPHRENGQDQRGLLTLLAARHRVTVALWTRQVPAPVPRTGGRAMIHPIRRGWVSWPRSKPRCDG